jgi:hypothetical protein
VAIGEAALSLIRPIYHVGANVKKAGLLIVIPQVVVESGVRAVWPIVECVTPRVRFRALSTGEKRRERMSARIAVDDGGNTDFGYIGREARVLGVYTLYHHVRDRHAGRKARQTLYFGQ